MKITVTDESQSLNDIMTQAQKEQFRNIVGTHPGANKHAFTLSIRNKDESLTIYIEKYADATADGSYPIEADEAHTISGNDLTQVFLVAPDGESVTDVLLDFSPVISS